MIAQTFAANTVLFFPMEDLRERSILPEQFTLSHALSLLESAGGVLRDAIPPNPEIQAFSSDTGVLLFLRPADAGAPPLLGSCRIQS
jgi:hypothetical protein